MIVYVSTLAALSILMMRQSPFALLEAYVGPIAIDKGSVWGANFYKCGDETSHPHWGAWSPVDELNFHLPRCFGRLGFAEQRISSR